MSKQRVTLTTVYNLLQNLAGEFQTMQTTQHAMERQLQVVDDRLQRVDDRLQVVDDRLQRVDDRLQVVEDRLQVVEDRLQGNDRRFDGLDGKFDGLDGKMESIQALQNVIVLRLVSVETKLDEHTAILSSLQQRVDALHGLVEKLEMRSGRLEQEYMMIMAALRRLETRFDVLEAQQLTERIRALESRVSALEEAKN